MNKRADVSVNVHLFRGVEVRLVSVEFEVSPPHQLDPRYRSSRS